jgi:subfamily B ATP-binding cassette protein MsbA
VPEGRSSRRRHTSRAPAAEAPGRRRLRPSAEAWREARELVWARRGRLTAGFALMAVGRLAGLVLPASSKVLIDEVVGRGRAELLVPLAMAAGLATLVQAGSAFALTLLLGVAAQRAIADLRRRVQRHVVRLPVAYFDSTKSGELISRILNDADGIRNLIGTGLVQLAGGLLSAAAALAVLLYLDWRLTAAVVLVLAVFAGTTGVAFRRLRPIFRERGRINAEVTGRLGETLGGIRLVKAFTAERREDLVFARGIHRLLRNIASSMVGISAITNLSSLVVGVVGVMILVGGGRSLLAGAMTLGDFVMYVFFTGLLAAPLVQVSHVATQLSEAFAGLDRIREIRRLATETSEDAGREPVAAVRGTIEFEEVSFAYKDGEPVLRDVSFRARAGSVTALVGSSGSGKSTLTGLVLGFAKPSAGRVLVDGRDLAALRLADYRGHLGVVFQDNFLFDGTIAENIAFGRPGASREELLAAGALAHCDEFALGFADGYDTIVGERGVKLSGGQRQRVAIARAILADPRILILDEATSSLDSESEALIQDGLRSLKSGRTTFVIAHRLSTIRSADQILVLEEGRIVERGTHAELLAAAGRYRQLHDRQAALEGDRFVNPGEDFTPEPEAAVEAAVPAEDPLALARRDL